MINKRKNRVVKVIFFLLCLLPFKSFNKNKTFFGERNRSLGLDTVPSREIPFESADSAVESDRP